MRLFLSSILCISFILSWPSALCSHAIVSLKDGNQLTGELSSIDTEGNIKILSPVSSTTLEVIHSAILKIELTNKKNITKHTSELVQLTNGDLLPCSLLSLDESSVNLKTWYAEDFKIPTSTVAKIEFHAKPDSLIYSGPNSNDDWDSNTNWNVNSNTLSCIGKGEIARNVDLPQNFILRSTITWVSARPIFKIHFCGDSSQAENMQESYSLDFSTTGIHVIRSSKSQPRAQIGEIPLRLRELQSNELDIELRVDRQTQTISVNINGKKCGIFDDTSFRVPSGRWINFESKLQQNSDSLSVKDISISQWSGSNLSSGNQDADTDLDTLFDTDGLRFTGKTQRLSREKKALRFEVKHASQPMFVPLRKIHSLYFSSTEKATTQKASIKYILSLQGGGSLTVESITLSSNRISAKHSILGEISLKPSSLQKITSTLNTDE